jgi:hypothetical protein
LNFVSLISTMCSSTLPSKRTCTSATPSASQMARLMCVISNAASTYGNKPPREFDMLLRAGLVDNGWLQCISDPYINVSRAGHVFSS